MKQNQFRVERKKRFPLLSEYAIYLLIALFAQSANEPSANVYVFQVHFMSFIILRSSDD